MERLWNCITSHTAYHLYTFIQKWCCVVKVLPGVGKQFFIGMIDFAVLANSSATGTAWDEDEYLFSAALTLGIFLIVLQQHYRALFLRNQLYNGDHERPAFIFFSIIVESIWRDRESIHRFLWHCRKHTMRPATPQKVSPSNVSSPIVSPVTAAANPIDVSGFYRISASNHLSPETLPASLHEVQAYNSPGAELIRSVTMSVIASLLVHTIWNIYHTIDRGVRVSPTLSEKLEYNKAPPSST